MWVKTNRFIVGTLSRLTIVNDSRITSIQVENRMWTKGLFGTMNSNSNSFSKYIILRSLIFFIAVGFMALKNKSILWIVREWPLSADQWRDILMRTFSLKALAKNKRLLVYSTAAAIPLSTSSPFTFCDCGSKLSPRNYWNSWMNQTVFLLPKTSSLFKDWCHQWGHVVIHYFPFYFKWEKKIFKSAARFSPENCHVPSSYLN